MKKKQWPHLEKPRERLLQSGARALSDLELLSIILGFKKPEESRNIVLSLIESSGSLRRLVKRPIPDLLQVPGIGPAEASSLAASYEFGHRILLEKAEKHPILKSIGDILNFLHYVMLGEREEVFMAILLDGKRRILKKLIFARGTPVYVQISVPSIVRRLNLEGAAFVIFAHNHPSNDVTPSEEDKALTRILSEACYAVGILMQDHLILGHQCYFSFAEKGYLKQVEPKVERLFFRPK
ncbi:MAG TPA: JAB domain-containing protein [Deltaproteobacteria bacterium]|nr:JAB domain-containing protein [Deltaproteobacteria bacterium]